MTFSREVKNELIQLRDNVPVKNKGLVLSGFIYCMRDGDGLKYFTENEQVVIFLKKLLKGYNYVCADKSFRITDTALLEKKLPTGDDNELGLFLRGVFLAGGVIISPDKGYHLELSGFGNESCDRLHTFINELGINIKKSSRKNQAFLYIKESEIISDFLTYIGAAVHSMELMNVKIYKEIRNNVNRAVNCEAANIEKTAKAAGRQIDDISLIFDKKGEMFLSPELLQVALLRLENVDMSLKDIGDACKPKITRSGVNHRLRKISEIAEGLKNE